MNESHAPENGSGGDVPSWMKTVSEETLYNARSTDEGSTPDSPSSDTPGVSAPDRSPEGPDAEGDDKSLRRKLSISMAPPSDIPEPDPDLQPEIVGHVRADLNRHLEKAVSVLETRYARGISKSLVIEFALRRTLLDLQDRDEKSALVQWLDSVLSRS